MKCGLQGNTTIQADPRKWKASRKRAMEEVLKWQRKRNE